MLGVKGRQADNEYILITFWPHRRAVMRTL